SVLAGMAVSSLASLAADWLMFGFRRPMLWNELQLLSVPFAAGLCCTVASYVTARLAPLVPVWHSAPFALFSLLSAWEWIHIGEVAWRVIDIGLAGPSGVALGIHFALRHRAERAD